MKQIAERARPDGLLRDNHGLAINDRGAETEFRLDVAARQPFENLETGIEASAEGRTGQRIKRIVAGLAHHVGTGTQRCHGRMVHFIEVVEH